MLLFLPRAAWLFAGTGWLWFVATLGIMLVLG
jgi:hypothetical protein